MRNWIGLSFALAMAAPAAAQPPELKLWRLDCGAIDFPDFDVFSDTYLYPGLHKQLTVSCYLIKHGGQYLLWDSGVAGPDKDGDVTVTLKRRVTDQLKQVGVSPGQINFLGISHYHYDHSGQAADFPGATLLIGSGDWDALKGNSERAARFAPWMSGGSKVEPVSRDKDVFGDGSVTILDMPGHTPGHKALLVRLRSGPVLLSGDLYHATEQVANRGVPSFNTNRADTLASFDRFQAIARNAKAKVIIQHEMNDIAKLPAFPHAAE